MTTKKIARRREWRSKRRMDILLSCLHLSPIHPQYPFLRRKHRYIVGNISEYERDIVYSPFKRRLSISTFGFFQEENCFAMNVARGSLRMNTLSQPGSFSTLLSHSKKKKKENASFLFFESNSKVPSFRYLNVSYRAEARRSNFQAAATRHCGYSHDRQS